MKIKVEEKLGKKTEPKTKGPGSLKIMGGFSCKPGDKKMSSGKK